MSTRAVHLELASDLSAAAFLNALTIFSSLRGRPVHMYSDNGTNLTAGEKEMREGLERALREPGILLELADQGISWHFNPPAAPHFGGSWERLVRTVKNALKAELGELTVKEDILRTTIAAAASIVNGRPLTHLGADPKDPRPLTPNHFLLGRENRNTQPDVFDDSDLLDRDRWAASQQIINRFWKRWLQEYLPTLIERSKWLKKERDLEVGDFVIIVDEQAPRGQWASGKIKEVISGPDKVVRSALVEVGNRIYKRPSTGLCLLREANKASN